MKDRSFGNHKDVLKIEINKPIIKKVIISKLEGVFITNNFNIKQHINKKLSAARMKLRYIEKTDTLQNIKNIT